MHEKSGHLTNNHFIFCKPWHNIFYIFSYLYLRHKNLTECYEILNNCLFGDFLTIQVSLKVVLYKRLVILFLFIYFKLSYFYKWKTILKWYIKNIEKQLYNLVFMSVKPSFNPFVGLPVC